MNKWVWIAIAVVAAIIIVGVLWSALSTRRTRSLRDRFGPEYDRELEKAGGRREAERELTEREKRHDELELRPLSDDARERYIEECRRRRRGSSTIRRERCRRRTTWCNAS